MSYDAARMVFIRANETFGANWTLHDLRHSAAKRMVRDPQLSLTDLRWVFGHLHISTTEQYLEPAEDEVVAHVLAHHARQAAEPVGHCVELQHAIGERQTNGYHGKHLFYALLAGLGVFGPNAPARLKTVMLPGQLTPAALVDRHGITCTAIRDLLVDYLTERAVDVDSTTLEDMARTLAGLFWRDLEKHHPGIDSLRLEADIVSAWRERVRMVRDRHGIPIRLRVNAHTVFSCVRTFYQDLARWAADEPTRWGPWVAPRPVQARPGAAAAGLTRARRGAHCDHSSRPARAAGHAPGLRPRQSGTALECADAVPLPAPLRPRGPSDPGRLHLYLPQRRPRCQRADRARR
ncbi:hypothetical protein [Streptomyces sp. WMMC1477]|uniref:hypothetical protein n=1 Tax=Streptomyces sp. WMMC1477 TaxID=3015155 RepID=UPI0022B63DFE|nr:hypothetical protein [Streptomyces sp. WMMC1477]MCZ7434751.1 hypothetical protein [Streptomyces sp. WMMC1477]